MDRRERIESLLKEGLSPIHVELEEPDEPEGSSWGMLVVSHAFEGRSRDWRQSEVERVLSGEIQAPTLRALTPAEWEDSGRVGLHPFGLCRGGCPIKLPR